MPEIITDRDLRHAIESSIKFAEKFIFIVSPYIDLDEDIKKAFKNIKPDVIKTIVYRQSNASSGESGISDDSRSFLNLMPNVELIAVKNLHAKFYMNEKFTYISTMNLTASSNHNYEIGVEIDNDEDYEMFRDCLEYLISDILDGDDSNIDKERLKNIIPEQSFVLMVDCTQVRINGKIIDNDLYDALQNKCNVKHGICIRCGTTKMNFSPIRPLCNKCFSQWNEFKNPTYQEKFCHRCGVEVNTTINDSLCEPCEETYRNEIEREWKNLNVKDNKLNKVGPDKTVY